MIDLEPRLIEAGLGRVASGLAPLARESVRLTAVEFEERATCRLGGRPNLSPQLSWPVSNGTPLAFIAQLDLAALPEISGLDLPRSGARYFFWQLYESARNVKDRGTFRVLYTGEVIDPLPLHGFPATRSGLSL
jgi:uncharacterized protein YwqG